MSINGARKLSCVGARTLEQAAQNGCEVSSGENKNLPKYDPGQPALGKLL